MGTAVRKVVTSSFHRKKPNNLEMATKLALGLLALCVAIQMIQAIDQDEEIKDFFKVLDKNNDAQVTKEEVNAYLKSLNPPGLIKADQIQAFEDNVKVADVNDDGGMDLKEFTHAMKLVAPAAKRK